MRVRLIEEQAELAALASALAGAEAIAVDIESNGLFVYRQRLCVVQLGFVTGGELSVAILDTLAVDAGPLASVLGDQGPRKVLHDLTFDARMLREHGVTLGHVSDTSVAARLLGRSALGLASLAASELGLTLTKELQHHNWAERPLGERELGYLAGDVAHLLALETRLATEVAAVGIADEVDEETRYKLREALAEPAPGPPLYLRVKGIDRLTPPEQSVVRAAALARERIAEARDLPPFKVAPNEFLFLLAKKKPLSPGAAAALAPRGIAAAFADDWAAAVQDGLREGALPPGELAWLSPRAVARDEARARRSREERLRGWRRREAVERGVDEQAVLPGHCVAALALRGPTAVERLAEVPGLGAFRVARYGAALAALLDEPEPEAQGSLPSV